MDNIPMRPPKLPGYDFVQMLGSGATATVYLYNQRMPARPVAVKASAKTLDPRAAALFNREANFMAKLSSHPWPGFTHWGKPWQSKGCAISKRRGRKSVSGPKKKRNVCKR